MTHKIQRMTLLALPVLALLVSCKSNPTSPASAGNSTYTFQVVQNDSLGNVLSSNEEVSTVVETNATYFGKSGLRKIVSALGTQGNITYFGLENGDVWFIYYQSFNGVSTDSAWVTLGFGSQTNSVFPSLSQTNSGLEAKSSGHADYIGTENVTIAGESFDTQKVRYTFTQTMGPPGGPLLLATTTVDTMWFAPRINYFVKQSITQTGAGLSGSVIHEIQTLKKYTL